MNFEGDSTKRFKEDISQQTDLNLINDKTFSMLRNENYNKSRNFVSSIANIKILNSNKSSKSSNIIFPKKTASKIEFTSFFKNKEIDNSLINDANYSNLNEINSINENLEKTTFKDSNHSKQYELYKNKTRKFSVVKKRFGKMDMNIDFINDLRKKVNEPEDQFETEHLFQKIFKRRKLILV